ncbi:zinc ribbon domain-containing protein [Methylicorpusculum sp.]|uniref:zinc ribbon domain-containing protein n=1 Tax=Methylicorpusculum sp. TaxID=2713644 RepID=UPI00272FC21C|nr:zinc ribbon domain-containing protein [Methylicorpusculum sp.]MDP2179418.1 zinc ribbon domain-containing protein [Methylicorpusculum sp.]MDP3529626.1 zinc ribbon domain-containing protein [Methylicorpusculum sp.]
MNTVSYKTGTDCRRAAQYLITILIVLPVGLLISLLPVMTEIKFAHKLMAADCVVFATKMTALILFYRFTEHALAAIAEDGKVRSFVRSIGKPLTILVIVIFAQGLLWQVIAPFVAVTGKKIFFAAAILLILAASAWLILKAYQSAPYLLEAVQRFRNPLAKVLAVTSRPCPSCGHRMPKSAKFCSQCGEKTVEPLTCGQCGASLASDQKYCWQCGAATSVSESKDADVFFDGE